MKKEELNYPAGYWLNNMEIFNRFQQRVVLFLIVCALAASAILIITHLQREKALSNIEIVHSAFEICSEEIIPDKVNINTAPLEELMTLPKIGTVTSKRITEYRKIYGGFKSIKEITKVKGIGPKIFEEIKEMITVGNIPSGSIKVKGKSVRVQEWNPKPILKEDIGSITVKGSANLQQKLKIDLNTASAEEIDTLPGIGPIIANRIIEYRKTHGIFQTIEEITNVKGIGVKTFEKIKEMITVKEDVED